MKKPVFSLAEKNLMVIYNTGTRLGLMDELGNMLSYLSPDDKELHDLAISVIKKLNTLSDMDFATLDFDPDDIKGW